MSLFMLVDIGNLKMSEFSYCSKTITNGVRDTPQHWTVGMWCIDVLDDDIRRCAQLKAFVVEGV